MKVFSYREVKAEEVTEEGAAKTKVRWLIDEKTGAKNFFMRMFEVEPGGYSPLHAHPWEHEIFILEGTGIIGCCDEEKEVKEGDFLYIEPDVPHWYKNNGNKPWKFLCIIPYKD